MRPLIFTLTGLVVLAAVPLLAAYIVLLTIVAAGPTLAATGDPVLINEVLASHTETDDTEYIEFFGTPGTSLDGLSLIVVESDDILSLGNIDRRIDFGPTDVLGANGFYLVGNPVGLAANYGVTPNVAIFNNFLENSSETIALVETGSIGGASVTGSEVVLDTVALNDGDLGDTFFFGAPVIGPEGPFFPAGARRVTDGVDTDTAADWVISDFFLGLANTPTPSDTPVIRDLVLINEVLASHTGTDDTEYIEFFGTPGTSLDGLSLIVVESDDILSLGNIDRRIDFGPTDVLGANGFYLVGNPVGLAANYGVTPNVAIFNNFLENSSETIALVETGSIGGASVTGSEVVLDTVALNDGDLGDTFFFGAPVIGPEGPFFPAGARRVTDGVDTDTAADWVISDFFLGLANTPTPGVLEELIDIKPGSCPNSINPKSRGTIPVAILSTDFDAPSEVDQSSLTFGRAGDEDSLALCTKSAEDVNGDGLLDQVCHFNTQDTGFRCGDTEGILRGQTVDGVPIEGRDSVRIVPCP